MKALALSPSLVFQLLRKSATEFSNDNAMRLAAALSYYSVFSIAPLLLIAIAIAGLVFGGEAASGKIAVELGKFIGYEAAQAIQLTVTAASENNSGGKTLVGLGLLLFGAATVFAQLKDALNTIWSVKQKPGLGVVGFLKERLLTFGIVLGIGLLLLFSLLMSTALAAASGYLEKSLHLPALISSLLAFSFGFAMETALFATIFQVLPDAKVRWHNVWFGAITTALLFEIGKSALSWYLGQKSTTSPFGAAGSLVVLLLWVYYASCILFFGAEFTKVYSAESGHAIEPSEVAVKVVPLATVAVGADGRVPSQPHPLTPNAPVPAVPMKETLAPLLLSPDVESPALRELRRPRGRTILMEPAPAWKQWVDRAHEHPAAEIGAAIGFGLLLGTLHRLLDRQAPALTAPEHFQQGAQKGAAATRSLLLAGTAWLARHLTKDALRRSREQAAKTSQRWARQAAARIEKMSH